MQCSCEVMQKVLSPSMIHWPPTGLETKLLGPLTRAPLRHVFIMTDHQKGDVLPKNDHLQSEYHLFRGSWWRYSVRPTPWMSAASSFTVAAWSKHPDSYLESVRLNWVPAVIALPTIFQLYPKIFWCDVHRPSWTASGKPRPRHSCSGTVNHGGGIFYRQQRCFRDDPESESRPQRVFYIPPLLQKWAERLGSRPKSSFSKPTWSAWQTLVGTYTGINK